MEQATAAAPQPSQTPFIEWVPLQVESNFRTIIIERARMAKVVAIGAGCFA
jgi:hypothetical protein